jgi:ESCRT-II complex subunit VPS25
MASIDTPPAEFWNFKPFFTLQPVVATREKQLNTWSSIILQYCAQHKMNRIDPWTFPLFENTAINRKLNRDGITAVITKLIRSGNAEWEDSSKTGLRIILKSVQSLAGDIYAWANRNDFVGTVLTLYEIHSGEDHQDSGFFGTDPIILKRAIQVLEREGKATILEGSTPEEDGVKFL